MDIPGPDDFARSLNQLAWQHLNRLSKRSTGEENPRTNVDPEALIPFLAIIGTKKRVRSNPRVLQEAVGWAKNHRWLLSNHRFKHVIKKFREAKNDISLIRERHDQSKVTQEEKRADEIVQLINGEIEVPEHLPGSYDKADLKEYSEAETSRCVQTNNRLFLRAFLSKTSRGEIVNYLAHGCSGNGREIHRKVLVAQPEVHRNLKELRIAGLVNSEQNGREVINTWIGGNLLPNPEEKWVNWCEVYNGLLRIHKLCIIASRDNLTDYQKAHLQGQIASIIQEKERLPHVDFSTIEQIPGKILEDPEPIDSERDNFPPIDLKH